MAKMKHFAVEVEIVHRRTVFVDARRPNGAIEKVMNPEGWKEAIRYQEDDVLDSVYDPNKNVTVVRVREAG